MRVFPLRFTSFNVLEVFGGLTVPLARSCHLNVTVMFSEMGDGGTQGMWVKVDFLIQERIWVFIK